MICWHYRLDEDDELRLCSSAELESLFVDAEAAALEWGAFTNLGDPNGLNEHQTQHWMNRAKRAQAELRARADGDQLIYRPKLESDGYMQCHATIWNKYTSTRYIKFRCARRGTMYISCRLYTVALCHQHTLIHKRDKTIRVDGKYLPRVDI